MTYREQLEQIMKDIYPAVRGSNFPLRWHGADRIISSELYNQDMAFIFKCFDMMRQVAIRNNSSVNGGGFDETSLVFDNSATEIDAEFEGMMSE